MFFREADMTFDPIGVFHGGAAYKYEAPRQGVFAGGAGRVELLAGRNFETALRGLDGFERIWLVFVFDRNAGAWRPTTRPPPSVDKLCLKQAENSSFFMVGHPRETGCSQLLPAHVGEYLRPDLWSEHRTSSSFLIT